MLSENSSLYEIYVHFFGLAQSGAKINSEDFATSSHHLSTPFTVTQRMSAVIAISDHKSNRKLKTQRELLSELQRLSS